VRGDVAAAGDPTVINQLVRSLLVQKLLLKEALSKKWDQEPSVVARLERARESAITESYLQSLSNPPDEFPNDAELETAYESRRTSLLVPRQFRLAQIFVAVSKAPDKAASDEAAKKLDRIRKALKQSGADFAAIARVQSEERESSGRGGEIGWLAETQIQPEVRAQLPPLAVGTVSNAIRLDDGWHIIKVLDAREPYTPTLQQIRPQLVQQLRAERARANSQAYLARLVEETPPAVNELALSAVIKTPDK
jgi:parvulin-like peptidyl-prolyl isomerase